MERGDSVAGATDGPARLPPPEEYEAILEKMTPLSLASDNVGAANGGRPLKAKTTSSEQAKTGKPTKRAGQDDKQSRQGLFPFFKRLNFFVRDVFHFTRGRRRCSFRLVSAGQKERVVIGMSGGKISACCLRLCIG